MGLRGPKPKGAVKLEWSADFAYAIGLIASDGCLSKDGRHIDLTSKDKEQIDNFQKALGINKKIGYVYSGETGGEAYRVQFSDARFWNYLHLIGLTSNKSKAISKVDIPGDFFFDFLRGLFDGDGSIHSYYDKRWSSSFMFYLSFVSASRVFIDWLQKEILNKIGIKGSISHSSGTSWYQLKYAKRETQILIKAMYSEDSISLSRKRLKIVTILAMIGQPQVSVLTR